MDNKGVTILSNESYEHDRAAYSAATDAAKFKRKDKPLKPQAEKLTARQQFVLELLKAAIAANGGINEQSVKQMLKATDQVFGEE